MLQENDDMKKKKEDEMLTLRRKLLKLHGKIRRLKWLCAEKDMTQANNSELIVQLRKQLDTLLMENFDGVSRPVDNRSCHKIARH